MDRRQLLRSSLALGMLGALGIKSASAAESQYPDFPAVEGLARLEAIMASNQVTVAKDLPHNHTLVSYDWLGSDDFLKVAQRADVRTIGVELPPQVQPAIDDFQGDPRNSAKGQNLINALDKNHMNFSFVEKLAIRTLCEISPEYNIKIVASDVNRLDKEIINLSSSYSDTMSKFSKSVKNSEEYYFYLKKLHDLDVSIDRRRMSEETNKSIVDLLSSQQTQRGGNLFAVYGCLHSQMLRTLFQAENKSTAFLALHVSKFDIAADNQLCDAYGIQSTYENHFLLDSQRFFDDPAVIAQPASSVVRSARHRPGAR